MFTPSVIASTADAAKRNGVEPAALLAVVEIESAGRPFEADGRTPRFLFERHVFYRELAKRQPEKLPHAVRERLANRTWDRATQYKDQGSSNGRMTVLRRARAIDEECANLSCSWGVGQTMGFHYRTLGFMSATAMVNYMSAGGLAAQIDVMCRNITDMKLWPALKAKAWGTFAHRYNGPGYKQNAYDTKMAAAYRRWIAKLANGIPKVEPAPKVPPVAKDAGKIIVPAGGAAEAARQAGLGPGAILAVVAVVVVLAVAGVVWWKLSQRRRADLPTIPSEAR